MDNNVPRESWGAIFFRVWQQLADDPPEERRNHHA
jgi:hypothetical protein